MMHSIWVITKKRRSKNQNAGVSLVELLVVLALVTVVLSLGYTLFSYGYDTFFVAEGRSDVQQNVRLVSDFIQREIRHSTTVELRDASISIPDSAALELAGADIIYRDSDGKIRHRNGEGEAVLVEGISGRISFDISFEISAISDMVMNYEVTGTRDNGQVSTLGTEVFIENLDFTRGFVGNQIKTAGNTSDYVAVYYVKPPSLASYRISVVPYYVYIQPGSETYSFELVLLNDKFLEAVNIGDIDLGLAFQNMSVSSFARSNTDDNKAQLVINGVLDPTYGTGLIAVQGGSLVNAALLEARVLILAPVGVLTATPNPTPAGITNEPFVLRLDATNSFVTSLNNSMFTFGGDFYGLSPVSVTRVGPQEVTLTASGTIQYATGAGYITVSGLALNESDTGLTASVTVTPPPPTYTLTIHAFGQGTTVPAPGVQTYNENAQVTVTATPATSWEFYQWLLDDEAPVSTTGITVGMTKNRTLDAHFRIPFSNIPSGSYIRYNSLDYIKLSDTRLLEADLLQENGTYVTTGWVSGTDWATKEELEGFTARGAAYRYWTASEATAGEAFYVEVGGGILTLPKESPAYVRQVLTDISLTSRYGYSGQGSQSDPIILK